MFVCKNKKKAKERKKESLFDHLVRTADLEQAPSPGRCFSAARDCRWVDRPADWLQQTTRHG